MHDDDLVRALKALADPTRFRIVQAIATAGELSCSQIVERFSLAQPTISHHLKVLSEAGILVSRAEAKHHFMSVDQELVARIGALVPKRLAARGGSRRARTRSRAAAS